MEICVDTLESARNAIEGGAHRLEVCSALSEGGLTPTPGMIKQIQSFSGIPIYAMIRVRCGNFVYTREEKDAMLYDLEILKQQNIQGFVFGALSADNEIDIDFCKKIISAAHPLPVTFHRAFDEVTDPMKSLEILVNLNFQRILTSGQKNTAEEGLELIKDLVKKAKDRIAIMPGSGITEKNIFKIKMQSGANEFHASARRKKFVPRTNKIKIGVETESDYIMLTDIELVKEMVKIVSSKEV